MNLPIPHFDMSETSSRMHP